jgi:hypothetical protein
MSSEQLAIRNEQLAVEPVSNEHPRRIGANKASAQVCGGVLNPTANKR